MKKLFLTFAFLLISVFQFAKLNVDSFNFTNSNKSEFKEKHNYEVTNMTFYFSNLESLQKFDFNSFLKVAGIDDDGRCTINASVTAGGVTVSFSVTADSCAEAGAGAAQAAAAFVKEVMK